MTPVTATELRANVYALLDAVLDTGEPLVVVRNGRRLVVVAADATPARRAPPPRRELWEGDFDDLVEQTWPWEPGS